MSRFSISLKKKPRSKRAKIFACIGIVLAVCVLIFIGAEVYDYYVGFGAPAHPSFVGYKPTMLPDNIKIVSQSLERSREQGLDIWTFTYSLKLNTQDLSVYERAKDPSEPNTVNCVGFGGICNVYRTPKGNVYRFWYNVYKNKPFGLEVDWTKGNTDVDIQVRDASITKYLHYDWSAFFDSMQPVNLTHMPYTKTTHSQYGG